MELDILTELRQPDTPEEKVGIPGKRMIYTIDFVRHVAKKHRVPQYQVRQAMEKAFPRFWGMGIMWQRTSMIFLSRWELHCCPMYRDSYISHVTVPIEEENP